MAGESTDMTDRAERGMLVLEKHRRGYPGGNRLETEWMGCPGHGSPPREIPQACALVIEFPLIEELQILRVLTGKGALPLKVVPVTSPLLQTVNIFQLKDFDAYLMVRADNMKLTVDKATRTIVNISGGGCPDVPYQCNE